jgi:hypothetical protein
VVPGQLGSEVCIVVRALNWQNVRLHLVPPIDPLTVVVDEVGDLTLLNSIEPGQKRKVSQVVCKAHKGKLIRSGVVMEELLVQVDGRGNLIRREGLGQS